MNFYHFQGALKRKSISFQESNSAGKVSKPAPAPAARAVGGGAKISSSVYTPPTGKYSKNVGQYGNYFIVKILVNRAVVAHCFNVSVKH